MSERTVARAAQSDVVEDETTAQRDELLGRLTGGVAHYFNNLMTTVLGFSELLLQELPQHEPARAGLEEIHKAGQQASAVTAQLLALARRQRHEPAVLDLNELVTDAVALCRPLLGGGVQLTTTLDPLLRPVRADRQQLRQVLVTLLLNAREDTPRGGRLVVATADVVVDEALTCARLDLPPGPYACVRVGDADLGVAPRLEAFFTSGKVAGKGRGMAAVREALRKNGGYLAVADGAGRATPVALLLPPVEV